MDAYLFAGALLAIALVVGRAAPSATKAAPARVAGIIALLGAIIALVQFGHDWLKP
ncbi:hypothetical protein [Phaeospirillum tilakii]|uniref:PEP-CTERM protein-sorting domain-containing protein n=1 Tax=Phaeospirillum tilakii TaxID=741673 RepID=A0ABW5CHR3_9PROT